MANPNIVNVATINGNMLSAAVGTGTPDTQILSNAASSGITMGKAIAAAMIFG